MLTIEANDLHRVILFEPGKAAFPISLITWRQDKSRVRYMHAFIVDRIEGCEASWNILRSKVCLSLEGSAGHLVMVTPRPLWRCTPADRFFGAAIAQPGELCRVLALPLPTLPGHEDSKYPSLPGRVVVGFAVASTEEPCRFS